MSTRQLKHNCMGGVGILLVHLYLSVVGLFLSQSAVSQSHLRNE